MRGRGRGRGWREGEWEEGKVREQGGRDRGREGRGGERREGEGEILLTVCKNGRNFVLVKYYTHFMRAYYAQSRIVNPFI